MGIDRKTSAVRRRGAGWHAIALFVVLAFALQSFVTQTHIHANAKTPAETCVSKCIVHTPLRHSPFSNPADCPFCQAIMHAGSFFAPATVAIFIRRLPVESFIPTTRKAVLRTASVRHGLSRAPPLN